MTSANLACGGTDEPCIPGAVGANDAIENLSLISGYSGSDASSAHDLKTLANQGVFPNDGRGADHLLEPEEPETRARAPVTRAAAAADSSSGQPSTSATSAAGIPAGGRGACTRSSVELSGPSSPRPLTRSGPPSPAASSGANVGGSSGAKKRRAAKEEADDTTRKSLRGAGVKNRGASKRPKLAN